MAKRDYYDEGFLSVIGYIVLFLAMMGGSWCLRWCWCWCCSCFWAGGCMRLVVTVYDSDVVVGNREIGSSNVCKVKSSQVTIRDSFRYSR